jgi:hypothetical protein
MDSRFHVTDDVTSVAIWTRPEFDDFSDTIISLRQNYGNESKVLKFTESLAPGSESQALLPESWRGAALFRLHTWCFDEGMVELGEVKISNSDIRVSRTLCGRHASKKGLYSSKSVLPLLGANDEVNSSTLTFIPIILPQADDGVAEITKFGASSNCARSHITWKRECIVNLPCDTEKSSVKTPQIKYVDVKRQWTSLKRRTNDASQCKVCFKRNR